MQENERGKAAKSPDRDTIQEEEEERKTKTISSEEKSMGCWSGRSSSLLGKKKQRMRS